MTLAWIDASAGVAGDMLLAGCVDAGAPLEVVQRAIDAVVPGSVELRRTEVMRAGMRACKIDPVVLADDPPHRHWSRIRQMLECADLPQAVRAGSLRVFRRLAEAEAGIHGTTVDDVHFHEVGALDAIADIVGTCAALYHLGIDRVVVSPIAVGSGTIGAAHGQIPVPVPAVLTMTRGWRIHAGGSGELATPTGVALVTALAVECGPIPDMRPAAVGIGAGTRDFPGRANVVRIVVDSGAADFGETLTTRVLIEANIDDLDPRVWPVVVQRLLDSGADDAWLVPVLMKKGRPAHTVTALVPAWAVTAASEVLFAETSTIGVRYREVRKTELARTWVPVPVDGGQVRIKVAGRRGCIDQATVEFEDAFAVARETGRPVRAVLDEAGAVAVAGGLVTGAPLPFAGKPIRPAE
ncbi:nickel pincer cofactor biosynthesis protein LarC [Nocardia carnea]|uniref:nickel pincer cofactor biosynthesis protein LarC n=1 Tax=Nocardia carnea TaxID=37328 RepID=UPI002455C72E|nr:nickel pincer cofactor biosynthesis protein LarC [Nocardia carnea]